MKINIKNAITAIVFLLTPIVYGAGNESLYMESVGRVNPSMAQVLTGEVQVSGIQSPTKLTLDLLLSNGSLYTVNDISVNQDGIYNIFELIDTTLLPQGIAILNVSSDKNLSEKNLLVDVSLQDFEEETPQTSTGSSGVSAMMGNRNIISGYSISIYMLMVTRLYIDKDGEFPVIPILIAAAISGVIDMTITTATDIHNDNFNWESTGAAFLRGFIVGSIAAIATPLSGSVIRSIPSFLNNAGRLTSSGIVARNTLSIGISTAGSGIGQVSYNQLTGRN